ncbi:MAG: molybdenum cofactor guanylyltransferase [Candidatus Bathyarchaeota archaeon]|jgi:molybdopterin-guanine dinucleotide biosynthesis protein A|nr:molybdenum cofactor guanylyltransferase [Candidatus Bathyarchaeota archaeon]
MRSAVILAGGGSTRMEGDKGLRELGGEPLVRHVICRLSGLVDEVLVVVGSEEQRGAYSRAIGDETELTVDIHEGGSPLVGALTGLRYAKGEYALITGCDMPFLSKDAIRLLFREAEGFDGATFRWPNGWIEPLIAVYRVGPSIKKAQELYDAGNLRLRLVLLELPDVKMIPIEALRAFDPDLITLYDADTEDALLEAEKILKENQTI